MYSTSTQAQYRYILKKLVNTETRASSPNIGKISLLPSEVVSMRTFIRSNIQLAHTFLFLPEHNSVWNLLHLVLAVVGSTTTTGDLLPVPLPLRQRGNVTSCGHHQRHLTSRFPLLDEVTCLVVMSVCVCGQR